MAKTSYRTPSGEQPQSSLESELAKTRERVENLLADRRLYAVYFRYADDDDGADYLDYAYMTRAEAQGFADRLEKLEKAQDVMYVSVSLVMENLATLEQISAAIAEREEIVEACNG